MKRSCCVEATRSRRFPFFSLCVEHSNPACRKLAKIGVFVTCAALESFRGRWGRPPFRRCPATFVVTAAPAVESDTRRSSCCLAVGSMRQMHHCVNCAVKFTRICLCTVVWRNWRIAKDLMNIGQAEHTLVDAGFAPFAKLTCAIYRPGESGTISGPFVATRALRGRGAAGLLCPSAS